MGKLKNITLSADADLIEAARAKAAKEQTTLNEEFRRWLEQFTRPICSAAEYRAFMQTLTGTLSGAQFDRESANER